MAKDSYNPIVEGAEVNFSAKMSYTDYLGLDQILSAQLPRGNAHDEMLFIIQHQTSELWIKLALHELSAARIVLRGDDFAKTAKILSRVSKIFEQLNNAWDVLRTMTPNEYAAVREGLGQSSGFQSFQYRMVEFMLGNRNPNMIKSHDHRQDFLDALNAELAQPSLYDEAIYSLARGGFSLSDTVLKRDTHQSYVSDESVAKAWLRVYQSPEEYWPYYELAEKLVDFEDYFRRWRFNHVTTVERVIGFKRGTGGTGGVGYLKRMLEVELFPELWQLRTEL